MKKTILYINGSSRKNGTSSSFIKSLTELSKLKDCEVNELSSIDYVGDKYNKEKLHQVLKNSDTIAIVTPLYIDTLPYSLIYFLEQVSLNYSDILIGKNLFVIGQSGFPDPMVLDQVVLSCELFAQEHNMNFLGGIRYGGGVMINGSNLNELGKKGKTLVDNFETMLEQIINGYDISEQIKSNLTNKVPKFLYRPLSFFLNSNTKKQALKNKIDNLNEKVYI